MAIDLTGISNVNEFYSHHYLDSVLEGDLKGLFTKWKESEEKSPVQNLEGLTAKFFKAKSQTMGNKVDSEIEGISTEWHLALLAALGYNASFQKKYLDNGNAIDVLLAEQKYESEYLWAIEIPFISEETSIFDYFLFTNKNEEDYVVATLEEVINETFRQNEAPKWILVLTGQKILLLNRHKWGQGKYLMFDLDEILGRKQQETLKATAALLSKDSLLPEEGDVLLDTLDENSHKHAFSVSEDLKYGIRKAVELLGNEYIYYRSKVAKQKIYGDPELANKLTQESLSYMYRLLFLFYAESRGEELNLVPVKSEEYRLGYSLESLRDLEQVPLITEKAREGYYLHESLKILFEIINDGYGNERQLNYEFDTNEYIDNGFDIKGLRSPLFDSKQTPLLSSIKIRNVVLQNIIQLLSLSKEGSKQRGRISYAQLGINQLGAVYEGLLSYSGFFAEERLFEVKPEGSKDFDEVYFVPESKIGDYKETEFVYEKDEIGHSIKKVHERGTYIFRLAGRDREKSASYYTPEVLTQSLVKYSLKELLKGKTADEILELKVCEPAMGSGAFLNETINQLAEAYLDLKQKELKQTIPVDEYTKEKQKVKYYIASNNIYGVDMNPVAIELAKVSLWLNVISDENETPWFSHKLANGNSLMGARLAVFDENLKLKELKSFKERKKHEFYHFLVLEDKMVGYDDDDVIKKTFLEESKKVSEWRKQIASENIEFYRDSLEKISLQIDQLLNRFINKRNNLLLSVAPLKKVWGNTITNENVLLINQKEQLLNKLKLFGDEYSILKCVFDYWTLLWIWRIDKVQLLPNQEQFLKNIEAILNCYKNPQKLVEILKSIGYLDDKNYNNNKFLHWYLEFPEIFEENGGFDLIIGNPPWIKLTWEEKGILSDINPLITIRKTNASQVGEMRDETLNNDASREAYLKEYAEVTGQKIFLNNDFYTILKSVQTNLYKNFIILGFNLVKYGGIVGILHYEGLYDDPKADKLRKFLYPKLISYHQYVNELFLFSEVGNAKKFGCSIFSNVNKKSIKFNLLSNLFHPKTIDQSYKETKGPTPGLKTNDFNWETKGHPNRIIQVDERVLEIINSLYENNKDIDETKLINIHSNEMLKVLKNFGEYEVKLVDIEEKIFISEMYHETNSQKSGDITRITFKPQNIREFVYSGPHFFVSNPLYQNPNEGCKSHKDYTKINQIGLNEDYLPRTNYKINKEISINFSGKDLTQYNRALYRKMLDSHSERTLIGALIPKGPSHINGCISVTFKDSVESVLFVGMTSSIVLDFYIRTTGKNNLGNVLYSLPTVHNEHPLAKYLISRVLRLNCVNIYYNDLWKELYSFAAKNDCSSFNYENQNAWEDLTEVWKKNFILESELDRRLALIEIDAIVALIMGISLEELISIYNSQFPVIQKYEDKNLYDKKGRLVPTKIMNNYLKTNDNIDEQIEGFFLPFRKYNRQNDMKTAYERFERIINS